MFLIGVLFVLPVMVGLAWGLSRAWAVLIQGQVSAATKRRQGSAAIFMLLALWIASAVIYLKVHYFQ